jgi:outer membrane protein OmpA-like peptidoglycan-associated protein
MRKIYYLFILGFMGSMTMGFAQNYDAKKADKYFERLQYVKAADKYLDIVEDGDADAYVYGRLAKSYYNLYNTKEAERYYKLYLETAEDASADEYYNYAQMLKANKKYDLAQKAMQDFAQKFPRDGRARSFMANPNYMQDLLSKQPAYEMMALENLNSELSDFGAYEFNNQLYFVSSRNKSRKDYGWNKQPTLDVYVATKMAGEYTEASLLPGDVNSKYHEGTVSITPDGQTMYFTRNDYYDGDYEKDSTGINQLKVFKATLLEGEWADVQPLPFNNSNYSTGHTALSPDGRTLYFSSDMPGGEGQSDLYKVSINEDGTFGSPQNLGTAINTSGRESFPFVDENGTLYFSSDGHLGVGGLDVFKYENGQVINIGKPINSEGDDFAFAYYPSKEYGFVSSNRGEVLENIANDNIYMFKDIIRDLELMVHVINMETGESIANAEVAVYNQAEEKLKSAGTNAKGNAKFVLSSQEDYTVQVNAEDYESNSAAVTSVEGPKKITIELTPIKPMIQEEEIVLNPIYFEFDKSAITKEGAYELDRLVAIMKKHDSLKIFVRAHTDKRGSEAYNLQLSQARAKSTVQYVIDQGIDASRIDGEGYGESQPKVECSPCTEEQYQENRRSEFKIVKE